MFSSSASAAPAPSEARWVAVHAGVGPARLLVSWASDGSSGGRPGPASYRIETSASSTNGGDGDWRGELSVTANTAAARVHEVEFDGQSWVRLTFDADVRAAGDSRDALGDQRPFTRLDLHDASDGTDDCWVLLGEPALVLAPAGSAGRGGWAEHVHERYPGYFPALIDEARAGEAPARALERLDGLLQMHSPARRVAIAFGAAAAQAASSVEPAGALEALVAAMIERGRLPVVARTPAPPGGPREAVESFNRRIDALERRHGLLPGPDLAAWFDAHPEQLDGEGRPSEEGQRANARLWLDALDAWYVPQ